MQVQLCISESKVIPLRIFSPKIIEVNQTFNLNFKNGLRNRDMIIGEYL